MMVRLSRCSALLALAGAGFLMLAPLGEARAQADNNFFGNIFRPPGQVRQNAPVEAPAADDPGSVSARMDRLESQLRTLTGQIEELQYRNQQLEQQVKALQTLIDLRAPGAAGAAGAGAVAGATPPRPSVAGADVPGAPRPLGGGAASVPSAPSGAPMDLGTLSGQVAAPAAGAGGAAASAGPKDQFDNAYAAMMRQDYVQAGQGFEQFIRLYPSDRGVPDAYYWLGESQYLRKSYKEAAQSFLKVSTDYPNALKAPDALLRLGQSLAAIGEKDAACATLNAVNNKYPRASTTIKQGVAQEQKRVGC